MFELSVRDLPIAATRLLEDNGFIERDSESREWIRPKPNRVGPKEIMEWWNALAAIGGQPQIRALNKFRVIQFNKLLVAVPNAMEQITERMGTLNDFARSARFITFDFILDSHKLTRLLEGNYSDESKAQAAKAQQVRVREQKSFIEKERKAESEALSPEESRAMAREVLRTLRFG